MGRSRIVPYNFSEPSFTDRRHWNILTTTVYSLSSYSSATPWIIAAVDGGAHKPLHPLTLKPHRNLPENFNSLNFRTSSLVSFHHADDIPFDKLIVAFPKTDVLGDNTIVALYGGGQLIGRLPLTSEENSTPWMKLSGERFDDVVVFVGRMYVVDRLGRLHVIHLSENSRALRLGKRVIFWEITESSRVGWRKRLFVEGRELYAVVREYESVFRVYKLIRGMPDDWELVESFHGGKVLLVSKDCCFFTTEFGGRKYRNCIVFSEAGFPKYGKDDGWEFKCEDEIRVFRLSDGRCGRVSESVDFPEIDWSPPSWISKGFSSYTNNQSQREPDADDLGVQSATKVSNREDVAKQKGMELVLDGQDQEQKERSVANIEDQEAEDVKMHSYRDVEEYPSLQEDVSRSLVAFVSAVQEEVTKTLLLVNGGNEAIEKENPMEISTLSAPRACTSSTYERHKIDTATGELEGFNIRSDLVPTLQKIWRKHGNIIDNSAIQSVDIIARALESLATMVQILENNSIESLSERQADYLSTTLSDLRFMCFNVHWLISSVEKAVKLHKIKPLVDSLNKLTQLNSRVEEHRAILLNEVAKLTEEGNKSCQNDSATAKFEGFDIRSDLVSILQKIWRNHGNIVENSTMRNADIITRALESLATVVQILDNTSVKSLIDSEADYLSSTLSDLKFMGFKVHYLVTFVEKAVKLHKSKTLVDSLNKLTQLSKQVKDRRAMLLNEVAKITEEENRLTKEMAKVSESIPFSGQVKFDEPLGLVLT